MKRRVGSKRDKPRKALEERLARMEFLLQLSNSENAATSSANREQRPEFSTSAQSAEMQNPESQSPFSSAMLNDSGEIMDGISTAEVDPLKDHPSFHSQMTQETSHTLPPLPAPTLTRPQHLTHHTLPEGVQDSSPHVECADLLGTEVCRSPSKHIFHHQIFVEINLLKRLDGNIMVSNLQHHASFIT